MPKFPKPVKTLKKRHINSVFVGPRTIFALGEDILAQTEESNKLFIGLKENFKTPRNASAAIITIPDVAGKKNELSPENKRKWSSSKSG